MKKLLLAALCASFGTLGVHAQVRSLDLSEMVAVSDRGVYGQIVSKRVSRVDAADGRVLYFTTMTIEGRHLSDGTPVRIDVSYPGGFVSEEEGYWHSESPGNEETRVGSHIVAFYKWFNGMGEAHATNWLYANHGGLYQTVEGPKGSMVLGRGQGYAVSKNVRVTDLEASVKQIRAEQAKQRNR